ncbi:MAG: transposase, partial [Candidatus Enterosoma sp.]|nr:transposase [bacterium]MDY5865777.1 transposase [Candidatus Enterosoma sp.]
NTSLSKAVNYFKNAWDDMLTFLKDGHLEMTNNAAERAIKPFVINRKNFLFCKTERGADATAELFSIIQTAQANLLIPDQYLSYVMHHIKSKPIEDLLPWSDNIPEELRIHKEDLEKRID